MIHKKEKIYRDIFKYICKVFKLKSKYLLFNSI